MNIFHDLIMAFHSDHVFYMLSSLVISSSSFGSFSRNSSSKPFLQGQKMQRYIKGITKKNNTYIIFGNVSVVYSRGLSYLSSYPTILKHTSVSLLLTIISYSTCFLFFKSEML